MSEAKAPSRGTQPWNSLPRPNESQIHGCTRTIRGNVRVLSCTAGAVHTWHIATVRCDAPIRLLLEAEMR